MIRRTYKCQYCLVICVDYTIDAYEYHLADCHLAPIGYLEQHQRKQ